MRSSAGWPTASLSLDLETHIKDVLKGLPASCTPKSSPPPAGFDKKKELRKYEAVYRTLSQYGFTSHQVEQALLAIPLGMVEESAALDWLCLNLDHSELPSLFTAGFRVKSFADEEVQVLHASGTPGALAAAPSSAASVGSAAEPEPSEAEPPWASPAPSGQEPLATPLAAAQEEEEQQAAAAAKAWTRQYMQQAAEEQGSGSESSSSQEMDDWELWADAREVERRRQARQRSRVPPEQRKLQLAVELRQCKQRAASAKASGDKAKQKEVGALIRGLRQEMEQLGVREAELEQLAPSQPCPAPSTAAVKSSPPPTGATGLTTPVPATTPGPTSAEAATPGNVPGAAPAAAAAAAAAPTSGTPSCQHPPSSSDETQAEEEGVAGLLVGCGGASGPKGFTPACQREEEGEWAPCLEDLFGDNDSSGSTATPPSSSTTTPPASQSTASIPLLPWGQELADRPARPGKAKASGPPGQAGKTPVALLSQQCQQRGWRQARYLNLACEAGQFCCSLELDMGVARGADRKKGWQGVKTFSLALGWRNLEDAKNAVAARALWELFGAELPLLHCLALTYRELWSRWDAETKAAALAGQQQAQEAVQALVARVLEAKLSRAGTSSAAWTLPSDDGGREESRADYWEAAAPDQAPDFTPSVPVSHTATAAASARLLQSLRRWQASPRGQRMQAQREALPIVAVKEQLVQLLEERDVVLVCGDTGCGKTTQVPQYILEHATRQGQGGACNVVCTQPRRIAATSVAERVAQERGEPAPGLAGAAVGFQVRLEAACTRDTRVLFCTTGILLRRLASESLLDSVTHVIVDEVHERSLQSDFLLALLRDMVAARRASKRPLKLILMSATLDAQRFAAYFNGCPVLTALGRTFPVQQLFLEDCYERTGYRLAADSPAAMRLSHAMSAATALGKAAGGSNSRGKASLVQQGWGDGDGLGSPLNPLYSAEAYEDYSTATQRNLARVNEEWLDYDLLEAILDHIDSLEPGAVLVFLPGFGNISEMYKRLSSSRKYNQGLHWVLRLHSSVSRQDQQRAFEVPAPGIRKIVLATNIAETSITIEDVVHVVDCGRHREKRYQASRRMTLLEVDWISQANARQRQGRAGRVREGWSWCMYTRHRYTSLMRPFSKPEITRVALDELVLQIHLLKLGPAATFLQTVLDPPPPAAVAAALASLREVGALGSTQAERLTPLGKHLALLPLDPRLGKLLVLGCIFGVLASCCTIAATMSFKSPFRVSWDTNSEAQSARLKLGKTGLAAGSYSDQLLAATAFEAWRLSSAQQAGRQGAAKHATFVKELQLDAEVCNQLQDMRLQLAGLLADAGLVATRNGDGYPTSTSWLDDASMPWNSNAKNAAVVKAIIYAALSPAIAVLKQGSAQTSVPTWMTIVASKAHGGTPMFEDVSLHGTCAAHGVPANLLPHPIVTFYEKAKVGESVVLRDVSVVSSLATMLFSVDMDVHHTTRTVLVNNWLQVQCAPATAAVVKALKAELDNLLDTKVKSPHQHAERNNLVILTIVRALSGVEA